ncbi:MAG: hypothetical protein GY789_23785 [Hyphomicrobiales bacterium]|nr:hypothetical protein [Hyphomicrobiales bacterium]MCP4999960.1 hypothetical protein [Hyphomicrobiales bacterium]
MGEQIPMDTLRGFVDATWVTDESLISRTRPDPNNGQQRVENPVWDKPDRRNRSFELRRITTEGAKNGVRTDFYEFYWAHLMHGTSWEHFKAWFADLLWRSPRRVPHDVFNAWITLWIVTIVVGLVLLVSLLPTADIRQCLTGNCDTVACDASQLCWSWIGPLAGAVGSIVVGIFVNTYLLKYFGDVARYVKATPLNVARRQEIREKGVELLETLMGVRDFDPAMHKKGAPYPTEYDRIIVVSHSLGTMVAYDVLKASFARINRYPNMEGQGRKKQPHRNNLERLLQQAIEKSGMLDLNEYRRLQNLAWKELKEDGNPWLVSDFITLGSPLTHAEFLLAHDEEDLRMQQEKRILPTCPPTLEWDQKTKHQHFSYRPGNSSSSGEYFRYPHHAAHFAFTRWTNIYSKSRNIMWGDIISGPVAQHFNLSTPVAELQGILDIPVLPEQDFEGHAKGSVPFFTHTKYWDMSVRTGPNDSWAAPYHIHKLREAINLLDK